MDSTEELLDAPVDRYIAIELASLNELLAIMGDIEIDNPTAFTQDGFTFEEGTISLNAENVVSYLVRDNDPKGCEGRLEPQSLNVFQLIKSFICLTTVANYDELLNVLKESVTTDLEWEDFKELRQHYLPAFDNVSTHALTSEGFQIQGIDYQEVDEKKLEELSE